MEIRKRYKIYLKKKSNKGKVSNDESFIINGKMITRHNDPADSFRIWKEKKAKGEKVEWKRGILLEYFDNKTADEIRDHVVKELEQLKKKMAKELEVSWEVVEE